MAHAHDTITSARRPARRADAGTIRLSQRDIDGLLLVGEHFGAPYDLLARALQVDPDRLAPILAGGAAPGTPPPGGWAGAGVVLADRDGWPRPGSDSPTRRRLELAHIRSVLVALLWLEASSACL
jgi:hypothetical protein